MLFVSQFACIRTLSLETASQVMFLIGTEMDFVSNEVGNELLP